MHDGVFLRFMIKLLHNSDKWSKNQNLFQTLQNSKIY